MSWQQKQIRRTYLDYFAKHPTLAHREVSSSPLIPSDDPTLLFTNAGMNQFKALLLGQEKRDYTRACSVQKCIRAGGKHNDLDAVGKDGRHLTFFEMLGNWSFGDYGKEHTIKMAWDLSVNVYGLDPNRIYVSVYKDDDESYAIWRDVVGVEPSHLYRMGNVEEGDEENFWSMGPTGPCGPCTELYFDLGPRAGTGPQDVMGGEGDRYLEFWNNVFMQYDRQEDGSLIPLPALSVDTGMGMERITMILQDKISVYETDIFQDMIQQIAKMSKSDWHDPQQRIDLQVIADHIRSLTFVLSEGGLFSNEGRGYVLRRILRRAVRHGRRLGFNEPFLWRIAPIVAEVFDGVYELPANILDTTAQSLKDEEARFFRTIDKGMGRIHAIMNDRKANQEPKMISGREAFELYDTFGFPVDLTRIEANEQGFDVDEAAFTKEMEVQKNRSRQAAKFYEDDGGAWVVLQDGGGRGFAGYGLQNLESTVMRYRTSDQRAELILDHTPFYAESGGEIADHGVIRGNGFEINIDQVQKINGIIHHFGALTGKLELKAQDTISAEVDLRRRQEKTIHHTATHLLHAALKNLIGQHVEQKGSVVEPNRLRFDFSHAKALSEAEIKAVELWVNERIRKNEKVDITENVPIDTAKAQGVTALFGEKYSDLVRTVKAGADSFELCGGNHVQATGDIGHFMIVSESAVAAGVRRIEAVVGHAAEQHINQDREILKELSRLLKMDKSKLGERINALQEEVRTLKKAVDKARKSGAGVDVEALLSQVSDVAGIPFLAAQVEVENQDALTALVDLLRQKNPKAVFLCAAQEDDKVLLCAGVGNEIKDDKRLNAGKLISLAAPIVGGKGGGRSDFAKGGGSDISQIATLIAKAPELWAQVIG